MDEGKYTKMSFLGIRYIWECQKCKNILSRDTEGSPKKCFFCRTKVEPTELEAGEAGQE